MQRIDRRRVSSGTLTGAWSGRARPLAHAPLNGRRRAIRGARTSGRSLFLTLLFGVALAYLIIPGDIFSPQVVLAPGANSMAPNALSRLVKLTLLGIASLVVIRRASASGRLLGYTNGMFLAFLALAPFSALWSISRNTTLARYTTFVLFVVLAMAICVDSWHARRFQQVARPVVSILLCASLVFGMLEPTLVKDAGSPAWHGLLAQKNPFGQLASFGIIFWVHAWLTHQSKPWRIATFGCIALICLALSRSSTAIMATVFAAIFMLMLLRTPGNVRRYLPYLATAFTIAVLLYALAILDLVPGAHLLLDPISKITGKGLTFSDRTQIWAIIREHIAHRPLIGSGYGAYWIGPVPSSPSFVFLERLGFYPSESHNGYLEVVNDLGIVGLLCLLGYFAVYVRQCLQLVRVDRTQAVLFLAVFFQQAVINLSESTWFDVDAPLDFMIMALATFMLARALMDRDRRKRPATVNRAGADSARPYGGRSVAHRNPSGSRRRVNNMPRLRER